MTQAQEIGIKAEPPAEPQPVQLGTKRPEEDMLALGRMAREVLEYARMPRHFWFKETSARCLIMSVLGRYRVERERVLRQRFMLRRLSDKVLQLKGELLGANRAIDKQAAQIREKDKLIDQLRRNRPPE